jgi:hypothetical protein
VVGQKGARDRDHTRPVLPRRFLDRVAEDDAILGIQSLLTVHAFVAMLLIR